MNFIKKKIILFLNPIIKEILENNKVIQKNTFDISNIIKKTNLKKYGDFSFPIFFLNKILKQNITEISKNFENKINKNLPEFIEKIEVISGFINFYIKDKFLIKTLKKLQEDKIILKSSNYDENKKKKLKYLIEFPSPNTNKSLHVGHSRNMLLGNSISNLLEKVGIEVVRVNLNNDRGISICYAMVIYEEFYKNKTPKDFNLSSDNFVSKCYSEFKSMNKKFPKLELEKKAKEMLIKWENKDQKTLKLWKKIISWVYEGYKKTYKNYKLKKFDYEFFESEIYSKGKEIIIDNLNKKLKNLRKSEDGSISLDLKDKKLGEKILLRADGTSLYITSDIFLANLKQKMFKADKNIFIVSIEQEYHFKVLFEILEKFDITDIKKNFHLAYGYVFDKEGNKFSSRNGNTIGADEILEKLFKKSIQILNKKNFNKKDLEGKAKVISFASLAFSFLKVNNSDSINFSFEDVLNFDGETASYILYTYARINSILKKNKYTKKFNIDNLNFNLDEINLVNCILEYPNILKQSSEKFKINLIANYTLEISQNFNNFYQKYSVLNEKNEENKYFKIWLLEIIKDIIKDSMQILEIEMLNEM